MALLRGRARPKSIVRPVDLVQSITFFTDLTAEEIEGLARILRPIAFVEGEVVVREGDPGDKMYLIARGAVEVTVKDEEGNRKVLDELGDLRGDGAGLGEEGEIPRVQLQDAVHADEAEDDAAGDGDASAAEARA